MACGKYSCNDKIHRDHWCSDCANESLLDTEDSCMDKCFRQNACLWKAKEQS